MKADKSQTAVQAMNVYQKAISKESEVRISSKGHIREVRLFDRFKEGLRSLQPGYKAAEWKDAAKNHIKEIFKNETELFNKGIKKEDHEKLNEKLDDLFKLNKTDGRQWIGTFLPDTKSELANNAILKIINLNANVDSKLLQFVRPALELTKGNIEEAVKIAELGFEIKKNENFSADIALQAAIKIISLKAIDKNLKVKDALRVIKLTDALVNKKMLDKDDAHIVGYEVWKIMASHKLKAPEAIAINDAAKSIVRLREIKEEDAIAIAHNRMLEMKKMQAALPRSYQLSLTDRAITKLNLCFSKKGLNIFSDYLKEAKDSINENLGIATAFEVDIERSFMKFITSEKTSEYSPYDKVSPNNLQIKNEKSSKFNNVVEEFKKFDTDAGVLKTLSIVCDQTGALAILAAAGKDLAADGQDVFQFYKAVDSNLKQKGNISRSYVEISKTETGDFQVRYTHLQRLADLKDSDQNSICAINRNLGIDFDQDVDKEMNNHTFFCEFLVEYKREDLKKSVIQPHIITDKPEINMKIQIDWTKIDSEFMASDNYTAAQ